MSYGFLQQSRDQKVDELMKFSPAAFLLVTQIARRARRDSSGLNPHSLAVGEALIGDCKSIGLTDQKYRTAKKHLEKCKIATFRATNKGTVATLCDSSIYNINAEQDNEPDNSRATNSQRTANEQVTTKKNVKKGKNDEEGKEVVPENLTAARGTKDEFIAYAVEKELLPSDGEWLFDKMLAGGWKRGGEPVRDWRATLRTWKEQRYFPSQKLSDRNHNNQKPNNGTKPRAEIPYAW